MSSELVNQNKMRRPFVLVLVLLSLALYLNTCFNGFVLDDNAAIVGNKYVTQGITAIPEIFSTPYYQGFSSYTHGLYRPVTSSLFALEYQVSGGSAFPGHLLNVLLFVADVLLLFFFLSALFGPERMPLSFITALLFALLPIHTEVVANIKSQDELLCFFFSFLSLLVLMKYADFGKVSMLAGGLALLFLALLSKETAVIFLGINLVLFFGFYKRKATRSLAILLGTTALVAVYIFIRFRVLDAYAGGQIADVSTSLNSLAGIASFWSREATAIFIGGKYLFLMLFPLGLACDYSYNSIPAVGFGNPSVMLSLLVYLIILGTGIFRLLRFRKDWLAFAIAFFLISFALFSNVFFLLEATMAERFMFFPSVGWCMAGAMFIYSLPLIRKSRVSIFKNKVFLCIFMLLLLFYGTITVMRNADWKDGDTLFTHDIQVQPDNYRMHQYLGFSLLLTSLLEEDAAAKNQEYTEAIQHLKRSAQIFPQTDASTYRGIGVSYVNLGQFDSAGKYLEQSLALNGNDTLARNTLAGVYFQQGAYQKSLEMCRINIRRFPECQLAYVNMGASYLKLGEYDSAMAVLSKAVSLAPEDKKARYFLSVAKEYGGR